MPGDQIYIAGLPEGFDDSSVQEFFGPYGTITWSKAFKGKGKGKGASALVQFADPSEATWMVENLNGNIPEGLETPIEVTMSKSPGTGKGDAATKGKAKGTASFGKAAPGKGKAAAASPYSAAAAPAWGKAAAPAWGKGAGKAAPAAKGPAAWGGKAGAISWASPMQSWSKGGKDTKGKGKDGKGKGKKGMRAIDPKHKVWVGGLPAQEAADKELNDRLVEHFKQAGNCKAVSIGLKGQGAAGFTSEEEAAAAVAMLNGSEFEGHVLEVDEWTKADGSSFTAA